MRRAFYLVSITVLLGMLTGQHALLSAAGPGDKPADVKIGNFSFKPAAVTVPVGTQVTWTNQDDMPHSVINDDQSIKSKVLDTDEKFSYTFTKPGTYSYFCGLHPKMKGTIVVQ